MYWVGWLHFPISDKWPYVEGLPYVPAAHSHMVTRTIWSRGAPYLGYGGPSVVAD